MHEGAVLGARYRLDELIGNGGMGEVWQAFDLRLCRPVAVKVVLAAWSRNTAMRARLKREAETIAKLDHHPAITTIHDIGEYDGHLFLVMELLRGEDFASVLAAHPEGLPIEQVLSYGIRIAEGLAFTHGAGVIHRDIKPANLMLLVDGRVKICDFGLARVLDDANPLTVSGQAVGTPAYMAPEQRTGGPVDGRADLYSLGCVLHELVTGERPFRTGPPTVESAALQGCLRRLLATDPNERTPSAAAAVAELRRIDVRYPHAVTTAPAQRPRLRATARPNGIEPLAPRATRTPNYVVPRPPTIPKSPRMAIVKTGAVGIDCLDYRHSVVFSPDNRILASSDARGSVRLWDRATGLPLGRPLASHSGPMVFTPDGRLLTIALHDQSAYLWDPATANIVGHLQTGHTARVSSVAMCPDGRLLASASDDGTVRLSDLATDSSVGDPLTGHAAPVSSVAFSPDGRVLASASEDGTVRLWDPATGKPACGPLTGHAAPVSSVVFSPDGLLLAGASGGDGRKLTVSLWDTMTSHRIGNQFEFTRADPETPLSLAFSSDSGLLVGTYGYGRATLWAPTTDNEVKSAWHPGNSSSAVLSPDGRLLADVRKDKILIHTVRPEARYAPLLRTETWWPTKSLWSWTEAPMWLFFLPTALAAVIGWLIGGHGIHVLGTHVSRGNSAALMLNLALWLIFICAMPILAGVVEDWDWDSWDNYCTYDNLKGFLLWHGYVLGAVLVVSSVFHIAAPGVAAGFLNLDHGAMDVRDWLLWKF
jgi:serine/threonine protein kinase